MERHDSVPEEQPWRFAGSDLDHFIRINQQPFFLLHVFAGIRKKCAGQTRKKRCAYN
jgi:hypothetical protein